MAGCQPTAGWTLTARAVAPAASPSTLALRVLTPFFPTPNLYTTPRTLPPGGVGATAAVDADSAFVAADERSLREREDVWPFAITGVARFGISDDVEAGLRSGIASGPGAYVKWHLAHLGRVDVATVPTAVLFLARDEDRDRATGLGLDAHTPFLVGYTIARSFTVVGTTGWMVRFQGGEPSTRKTAAYARFGGGVAFRTSELDVQPELTFLVPSARGDEMFVAAGVSLSVGSRPGDPKPRVR